MLDALFSVLLTCHLLLVDLAMVGPLVCVWLEWRETRFQDQAAGQLGRWIARLTIGALAGGIALGMLLLAARWWQADGEYFSALAALPRTRLWFGLGELLFYFVCMGAYVRLWDRWRKHRLWHRALAIAAGSNLLIHFPALFAIVSLVSTRPDWFAQSLDRSDYQRLLFDGEVLSRVTHVWLAAITVSGIVLMGCGSRLPASTTSGDTRAMLVRRGAWLALCGALLQLPSGFWLAWQMPEDARERLLGGDPWTTGLFAAALLLVTYLLHVLAAIALGDAQPGHIRRATAATLALVLLMVGARSRSLDQMRSHFSAHRTACRQTSHMDVLDQAPLVSRLS